MQLLVAKLSAFCDDWPLRLLSLRFANKMSPKKSLLLPLLLLPLLLLPLLLLLPAASVSEASCPKSCNCSGTTVDCSDKKLTAIPTGIPSTTTILKLNNNNIASVDKKSLQQLGSLTELYFTDNQLTTQAAGAMAGLSSLEKLYIARNKLQDFPEVAKSLKHLGLDENQIDGKAVPQSYAMSSLRSLTLTKNVFKNLTMATLAALPKSVQSVKLNAVQMRHIAPAAFTTVAGSLMSLDLSSNSFDAEALAASFADVKFPMLTGLMLKSSQLKHLPRNLFPQAHFPALNILHLDASASLAVIESGVFNTVSQITRLFLNGCPVRNVSALSPLKNLEELRLSGSSVANWTSEVFDAMSLKKLDLSKAKVAVIGGVDGKENPLHIVAGTSQLVAGGVRIDGNPLVCDCGLLWLTQQLAKNSSRSKFDRIEDVDCTSPGGKKLKLIECRPTGCGNQTTTSTSTTSTTSTSTTSTTTSATTTTTTSNTTTTTTSNTTSTTAATNTTTDSTTTDSTTASSTTPAPRTTPVGPRQSSLSSATVTLIVCCSCLAVLVLVLVAALTAVCRRRRQSVSDEELLLPGCRRRAGAGGCLELRNCFGRQRQDGMQRDFVDASA